MSSRSNLSKLVLALQSLSNKDIKSFDKFVSSPYHNSRKELISFWKILKHNPEIEDKHLFNQIFPRQPYDNLKLRHAKSHLLKLLESFFVIHSLSNSPYYNFLLIQQFHIRRLDLHLQKKMESLDKADETDFFLQYKLMDIKNSRLSEAIKSTAELKAMNDSLEEFYKLAKIKLLCEQTLTKELPADPIPFDIENLKTSSILNAFSLCYRLLSGEEDKKLLLLQLLEILESQNCSKHDYRQIVFYMLSATCEHRNCNDVVLSKFETASFELTENKIAFLINRCLAYSNYELAHVILDRAANLPIDSGFKLGMKADIHFSQKEFRKCQLCLDELLKKNDLLDLRFYVLRIQLLYELANYHEAKSELEIFEWRLYKVSENESKIRYQYFASSLKAFMFNKIPIKTDVKFEQYPEIQWLKKVSEYEMEESL